MSDKNGDEAPLPKGWTRMFSKSQKKYYYSHAETKHTQWHAPTASEVADPLKAKKRAHDNEKKERERMASSSSTTTTTAADASAASVDTGPHPSKRQRTNNAAPTTSASKKKPTTTSSSSSFSSSNNNNNTASLDLADTTSVAIIVPFRDIHTVQHRAQHLKLFIPHMVQFLGHLVSVGQVRDFHIYIIEQSDDGRKFNRGKLLNIGFDIARKTRAKHKQAPHDVYIFHDVDLLPQPDLYAAYAHFPKSPYHIARVWDRYSNNPKYFGGVVSMSSSDFKRINGYPNTFWGWGGEDDEFQKRCETLGMTWEFPHGGTLRDLEEMSLTEKLDFLRHNKSWKCMVKWEALEEHATTWKTNGLSDLSYQVLETTYLDVLDSASSKKKASGINPALLHKASKITVDVKLNGTHWANDKCGMDFMGDWKK
jgi:hypothetical protein